VNAGNTSPSSLEKKATKDKQDNAEQLTEMNPALRGSALVTGDRRPDIQIGRKAASSEPDTLRRV